VESRKHKIADYFLFYVMNFVKIFTPCTL